MPGDSAAPSLSMPTDPGAGEITRLLRSADESDREILDRVVPLLYDELRAIARRQLAREHGGRALEPTTLVHEAYLKLAASMPHATNRAHVLGLAAHAMRQVLVDRARSARAAKRGARPIHTTLTDAAWMAELEPATVIALDDAMERLEPRQRRVVECRFFAGMSDEEIAAALGVTARTVRRDWVKARAWLNRWLGEESKP